MKRTFDLHTHILYGVDDGARTMRESLALLEEASEQGVTDIVLTPHYRKGMFAYPTEDILKHFLLLKRRRARWHFLCIWGVSTMWMRRWLNICERTAVFP